MLLCINRSCFKSLRGLSVFYNVWISKCVVFFFIFVLHDTANERYCVFLKKKNTPPFVSSSCFVNSDYPRVIVDHENFWKSHSRRRVGHKDLPTPRDFEIKRNECAAQRTGVGYVVLTRFRTRRRLGGGGVVAIVLDGIII